MPNLYLERAGTEVRRDGESLAIYEEGSLQQRVPLRLVERLVVRGDVSLHAGALTGLALHGGSVLVLPRRHSAGEVLLSRGNGPDAARRLRQYELAGCPEWSSGLARNLVRAKLRGGARMLFRAARQRSDLKKELGDAIALISTLEWEIKQQPRLAIVRLMGIEGAAAAAFFSGYRQLFASSLGFANRNRRPPKDPVNACLSLAYTLLHAEAVNAILGAGLDPSIGFLHQPSHNRESFACDLVEILRPHAEEWVWQLFRNQELRAAHFQTVQGGCLLGKAGRRTFYEKFESLRTTSQRRLHTALRGILREWHIDEPSNSFRDSVALGETDSVSHSDE